MHSPGDEYNTHKKGWVVVVVVRPIKKRGLTNTRVERERENPSSTLLPRYVVQPNEMNIKTQGEKKKTT